MLRLFLGLPIEGEARKRLVAGLARYRRKFPEILWEEAEALHLTVRFIGAWEELRVGEVAAALADLRWQPFAMELRGLGAFPHTIWAGVAPSAELETLAEDVNRLLERIGLARESRKFRPHVSLARVREANQTRRMPFDASEPTWGMCAVRRLVLYETVAGVPAPVRYRVRAEIAASCIQAIGLWSSVATGAAIVNKTHTEINRRGGNQQSNSCRNE